MNPRSSRFLLIPALALICLLAQPVALVAQCAPTGPAMINTFTPNRSVYYFLTMSGTCMSVANMNVNACFPTAVPNMTNIVVASATTMAVMPSCSWTCQCGASTPTFQIDGNDGLPVELMDFAIEGEVEVENG